MVSLWTGIHDVATVCAMALKRRRTASPTKSVKDEIVRMRVSAEQKAALQAAADRDGLELSQWLRQLALRAAGLLSRAHSHG